MKRMPFVLLIICLFLVGCSSNDSFNNSPDNSSIEKAVEFYLNGEEKEAYKAFVEIDTLNDEGKQCAFEMAQEYIGNGELTKAYAMLKKTQDYENSNEIIQRIEEEHPSVTIMNLAPGETFVLGTYEQDNDQNNGSEPIEWILLSKEDGNIYAISKNVLDAQKFNESNTWSASIYTWLNEDFYNEAFSEETIDISRICLLKYSEKKELIEKGVNLNEWEFTPYALSKDPTVGRASGLWWWIEKGCEVKEQCSSAGHYFAEMISESYPTTSDVINVGGVRPTIWLFTSEEDLPKETAYDGSASDYRSEHYLSRCQNCNGTGFILAIDNAGTIFESERIAVCPWCDGKGKR